MATTPNYWHADGLVSALLQLGNRMTLAALSFESQQRSEWMAAHSIMCCVPPTDRCCAPLTLATMGGVECALGAKMNVWLRFCVTSIYT